MCNKTDIMPRRSSLPPRPPPKRQIQRENSMKRLRRISATIEASTKSSEIALPSRRRTLSKSVSFDEVVMVRPVLPLSEYTDLEIISSWFLPVEKKRIKLEIHKIIKMVKERNTKSQKQFNVRGLEWLTDKEKTREKTRKQSVKDILHEQEFQRIKAKEADKSNDDSIIYDDKAFRKSYRRHSRAAAHHAHNMGKMDEMEAGIKPFMLAAHHSSGSLSTHSTRSSQSTRSTRSTSTKSVSARSTSTRSVRRANKTAPRRAGRRSSLEHKVMNKDLVINKELVIDGMVIDGMEPTPL